MQLLHIKIDNAFSFGKNVIIDFSNLKTHTQLLGVNLEEDPEGGASNGSGKSSIPIALQECLYGKNSRGIKKDDIQNRNVKDGYSITTTFLDANLDTIKVTSARTSSGKGSVKLIINNIDKSSHTMRDTLKSIEEIIGLDYHTFVQLTYQSTDKTFDILKANEAARSKLLVGLFALENYTDRAKKAKGLSDFANTSLLEKIQFRKRLVNLVDTPIEVEKELKEFADHTLLVELQEREQQAKFDLQNVFKDNKLVDEERKRVDLNNSNRLKTIQKIKTLKLSDDRERDYDESAHEQVKLDIHTTNAEIASLRHDVKLYGEAPKNCRECGAPVKTGFNADKLDIAKSELQISNKLLDDLTFRDIDLEQRLNFNRNIKRIKKEILWLEDTLVDEQVTTLSKQSTSELQNAVIVCSEKLEKVNEELHKITDYNAKAQVHNAIQKDRATQVLKATKDLEEIDSEIKVLEYDLLLKQTLTDALALLVKFKLENLLILLQDSVNKYMSYMFKKDIALLIGLKNKKLSFSISIDGESTPVEGLSGGEYSRVTVALLFAVRESLSKLNGVALDFLFLDEVLATLDGYGVEALYNIIDTLDCRVISVSHSVFDNKLDCITVVKNEDGIAHVET